MLKPDRVQIKGIYANLLHYLYILINTLFHFPIVLEKYRRRTKIYEQNKSASQTTVCDMIFM